MGWFIFIIDSFKSLFVVLIFSLMLCWFGPLPTTAVVIRGWLLKNDGPPDKTEESDRSDTRLYRAYQRLLNTLLHHKA
ncbi:hypothetical protein ACVGWG_12230, partial [Enterobacter asburiae]